MYRESFPGKLKRAREKTGFTQREVQTETGIHQSQIAKYETGHRKIRDSCGLLWCLCGLAIRNARRTRKNINQTGDTLWDFGNGSRGKNPDS